MSKRLRRRTTPEERQEKSSTRATLPYQGPRAFRPAIFVLNLLLSALWWLGYWIVLSTRQLWVNRWGVFRGSLNGVFRIATLLSVGYLVYDRIFETGATLSASASDPKFAFEFPFVITNPSHIFAIRNVRWSCQFYDVEWQGGGSIDQIGLQAGSTAIIEPGQLFNFDCFNRLLNIGKQTLTRGAAVISLEYDADFFGIFSLHRKPISTPFTWWASASNPQWIKGQIVR